MLQSLERFIRSYRARFQALGSSGTELHLMPDPCHQSGVSSTTSEKI